MDDQVKVYNTDFDDLKFEYEVTAIVYSDGTTEQETTYYKKEIEEKQRNFFNKLEAVKNSVSMGCDLSG